MRIEIVTDTFAPDVNGVAMTLARLTRGLRERGHPVHVVHTGARAGSDETVASSFPLPCYRDVRVGLPMPLGFRARWRSQRPDVVYVATEGLLGKSALKAARSFGIPVATGFHTNFHEYLGRYLTGGLEALAMAYLRRFHRLAGCTLTPSPEMASRLAAQGVREIHRLGRGVDTRLFAPEKRCQRLRTSWGAGPDDRVALMVGRVAAEKNLGLGFEAFRRLRGLDPSVRCVVVGSGPLLAESIRACPWAHFPGVVVGEELARHYASADLLLFPSTTETFGNVLLEGMASGLATVSFDYAASALHVVHAVNGFKAAKHDADGFIDLALEAAPLRPGSALRVRARETARENGWEEVVEAFEGHLAALVSRAHVPGMAGACSTPSGAIPGDRAATCGWRHAIGWRSRLRG